MVRILMDSLIIIKDSLEFWGIFTTKFRIHKDYLTILAVLMGLVGSIQESFQDF